MFKSTVLGRPLGVEVRIHGTTLLFLGLFALITLIGGGLGGVLEFAFLATSVLTSVTLHELGHIVAARRFGIGTTGVTLYPIGGLARLTREPRTPREEVIVALAGPAVNVFLAGLSAIPLALFGALTPAAVSTFLSVNVVLAVFNLLPAYPMDGGRVLRGALWRRAGYTRATRWAARTGQVFALGFGLLGLFASPMLVLIAVFVFLQASAELGRLELARQAGINLDPSAPQRIVEPGFYHHPFAGAHGPWASAPPRPTPPRPRVVYRVVSEPPPPEYWRGRRVE